MLERQRREDAAAEAAEAAAFTALLSPSEQQRHDGLPASAGMTETVSHLCTCIGSPCLRHCVHGASIGRGG
eukprot:COSAG01_NODE_51496_length_354_cov_1.007843_1_plen_70_part_10